MNAKIFGGVIAVLLLGVYVYLVYVAVEIATCVPAGQTQCSYLFSSEMTNALTFIGGLVSALVIAELAITPPGKAPAARFLDAETRPSIEKLTAFIVTLYVLVWLCCGFAAFWFGYIHNADKLKTLHDLGSGWLGLVVAAAYAWLGIRPPR